MRVRRSQLGAILCVAAMSSVVGGCHSRASGPATATTPAAAEASALSTYVHEMKPRQAQITRSILRTQTLLVADHGPPVSRATATSMREQAIIDRYLAARLTTVRPPAALSSLQDTVAATLRDSALCLSAAARGKRPSAFWFSQLTLTNPSAALGEWCRAMAAACEVADVPVPGWLRPYEQTVPLDRPSL